MEEEVEGDKVSLEEVDKVNMVEVKRIVGMVMKKRELILEAVRMILRQDSVVWRRKNV